MTVASCAKIGATHDKFIYTSLKTFIKLTIYIKLVIFLLLIFKKI